MMHSSNGNSSDRYLPMDYGMHHAPHHPQAPPSHHPGHPGHDPHLHYALPPSHHTPLGAAPPPSAHHGMKRSPESAGLDMMSPSGGGSSDDDEGSMHDVKPNLGSERGSAGRGQSLKGSNEGPPAGKKTKGRVKIKMEFIDNKLRRYTTFSKRKTGIMKKAYELSTLTGTQVMLLVASETGHVYTFATRKLQPMITSDAGKALIQTCLNSPDPPQTSAPTSDQRMSASGYEETELTYNAIADAAAAAAAADAAEQQKVRQMMYNSHHYPLFSPGGGPTVSSHGGGVAGVGPPTSTHMSMSPYPAPSPSPSHHQVGGVTTSGQTYGGVPSPSPSHHSPPFLGSHLAGAGQHPTR